jgi:hypothetical protein
LKVLRPRLSPSLPFQQASLLGLINFQLWNLRPQTLDFLLQHIYVALQLDLALRKQADDSLQLTSALPFTINSTIQVKNISFHHVKFFTVLGEVFGHPSGVSVSLTVPTPFVGIVGTVFCVCKLHMTQIALSDTRVRAE